MNRHGFMLGASFGVLTVAVLVLFQAQAEAPSSGGGSASLTSTYVGYGDGSNAVTGENVFTYDATNNRLAVPFVRVGTAFPAVEFGSGGAAIYSGASAAGDLSFYMGGSTRYALGNNAFIPTGGADALDLGTSLVPWNEIYLGTDGITLDCTDSTGTPGAATINKTCGSSAIAVGASSVVITNSKVATTSQVLVANTNTNAGCLTTPWVVTKASGSFTVTAPANCTVAAATFDWFVVR